MDNYYAKIEFPAADLNPIGQQWMGGWITAGPIDALDTTFLYLSCKFVTQ